MTNYLPASRSREQTDHPPDDDDDELESYPWSEILNLPKREILIPDLAYTAGVTTLVAESGGGKTTLVSSAAWTTGIGASWAGKLIKPRPVIWVAGEGQYDLGPIYHGWMNAHPGTEHPPGRFLIEPIDLSSGRETDKLIKLANNMDPPLVVTDALADMLGGLDESKNKDMQQIYKNVWRVVFANQASFLIPHHSGWDNTRERGAHTIRAKSDIVVQIVNYNPVGGFIELKHHKRRGGVKRLKFTLRVKLIPVAGCPEPVPVVTGDEIGGKLEAALSQPAKAIKAIDEHTRKVVEVIFATNMKDAGFTDLLELTDLPQATLSTVLKITVGKGWPGQGGTREEAKVQPGSEFELEGNGSWFSSDQYAPRGGVY